MSFSASFLFQDRCVSDPSIAVSERRVGPTVQGKLKAGRRNPGLAKASGSELSVTGSTQVLDEGVAGIFLALGLEGPGASFT